MRILYLDCGMGAAGDMLAAALLELLPEPQTLIDRLNRLGIPDVQITKETSVKCGISGTRFAVRVNGEEETEGEHSRTHRHSGLYDISHVVSSRFDLADAVKADILAVYRRLAEAESHVHGVPVTDIHFHEVGTMDALADITAVCLLMHEIAPDAVVVSPVHVGSGTVRCAHGILPVPAPATAYLLKGVPIYGGKIQGELCTPTGAALLTHFATRFGDMPAVKPCAIGYGMGKKDFERANCLRAILGESADEQADTVVELSCNVDDMTAEEIGFAMDRLYEGGALEVYTVPVGMKKNRPGVLIKVLCSEDRKDATVQLMFRHTSTIGIRENKFRRYVLTRTVATVDTPYGPVRRKDSSGYGVMKRKYEYNDLLKIAKEHSLSLEEVKQKISDHKK